MTHNTLCCTSQQLSQGQVNSTGHIQSEVRNNTKQDFYKIPSRSKILQELFLHITAINKNTSLTVDVRISQNQDDIQSTVG